jgi:hypothetical protein
MPFKAGTLPHGVFGSTFYKGWKNYNIYSFNLKKIY